MNPASQVEIPSAVSHPHTDDPESVVQPMESVQLLKASIRCLFFGAAGMVPFFGIGLAYVTLRLGTELLDRTCEEWKWKPFTLLWIAGALEITVIQRDLGLGGALMTAFALLVTQACLVARRYLLGRPSRFNAARLHVFGGMGLALTGLAASLFVAAMVLGASMTSY